MAGCIGPFYNPYPLSKLVAKVGPPLKLNTMSVEEQINAEIQAEAKTESSYEIKDNSEENNNAESSDLVQENSNELNKEKKISNLEKILSSTSWRQAIYRAKYLKIIAEIDKKTHDTIRSLLIEIGKQKLSLEAVLRKKRRLKRDKEKTLSEVRNKKRKEQRALVNIRQSQKELKTYLTEKQAGVKQLETIIKKIQEDIARAEREERIRRQQLALKSKEFPKLKGGLDWPAEGRVITKFGRQWNPKLKTTTENPGIDIKGNLAQKFVQF